MKTQEAEINVELTLNYKSFGLAKKKAKTILILHALTGNSNVTGENGWWKDIVGIGKTIDTTKYHVVAIDIPGNGANGKFSEDLEKYDSHVVSRIISNSLKADGYLEFDFAFGVSLGGGLLWDIILDNPNWIKKAFVIAAHWETSKWLKGITHVQNEILKNSIFPVEDARKMAMFFYRSPQGFEGKFEQNIQSKEWLDYHGVALEKRFAKEAYLLMNHLLGTIDALGAGNNFSRAVEPVTTEFILVGINSDFLFTATDIIRTHKELKSLGKTSNYEQIDSIHGHDAFLIEKEQIETIINKHITINNKK